MRIFYGLERMPRSLSPDDPRLPFVEPGSAALRLNTIPLPYAAWAEAGPGHEAHWAALEAWLLAQCGDYNKALRRSVTQYLARVSTEVTARRAEIEASLARFEGLYQPEDWSWSALRPLPRAWWQEGEAWRRADLAFWDGREVMSAPPPAMDFWAGECLPRSPFRRVIRPSSP
jgi:hypothetical protein